MKTLFYILTTILILVGLAFKIQHWPYSGILLIISLVSIAGILLKFTFDIRKSLFAILPFLFSIMIIGVLFEIQHWPFPNNLIDIISIITKILFPILFISRSVKLKKTNKKLSTHLMIIGILLAIFAVINIIPDLYHHLISGTVQLIIVKLNFFLILGIIAMMLKTLLIKNLKTEYIREHRILKFSTIIYSVTILAVSTPLISRSRPVALEQFNLINEELEKSAKTYQFYRPDLYPQLDSLKHPEKERIIAEAYILKQETAALLTYIQSLKLELINESGGKDENEKMRNPRDFNSSEYIMIKKGGN